MECQVFSSEAQKIGVLSLDISITIKQNPLTIRSKGSELRSPLGKVGIPIDFSYYAGGPVLFGFLKFCLCCPNEGYSKTQFSTPIGTFFKVCTIFCEIAANQRKREDFQKRLCKNINSGIQPRELARRDVKVAKSLVRGFASSGLAAARQSLPNYRSGHDELQRPCLTNHVPRSSLSR